MNISNELLEKAKKAKSAEELLEMAKTENIELSAEEAAKYFAELHKSGELSDEELDNVAGGMCGEYQSGDTPKFSVGQRGFYSVSVPVLGWGCMTKNKECTITKILPKENNVFKYEVELEEGGTATILECKFFAYSN